MIKCKINLYVVVFNKKTLNYDIVSLKESTICPMSDTLEANKDVNTLLKEIFEKHIELQSSFVSFVLSDVTNSDELNINYYCLVPYDTIINNSYLVPININEIHSPYLRKIFNLL
jgi:hypothetical protein